MRHRLWKPLWRILKSGFRFWMLAGKLKGHSSHVLCPETADVGGSFFEGTLEVCFKVKPKKTAVLSPCCSGFQVNPNRGQPVSSF